MIINDVNRDKIGIIVVGYNRIKSIKRLLSSLLSASYFGDEVPLVISIDCSRDQKIYEYVHSFEWPYGDKIVNIQQERLGLKNHILLCGDLSRFFKAIVLLEDDIIVSPYFYSYVKQAVEVYGTNKSIAQISLYKNEMNGYVGLPFSVENKGFDVFLHQDVSTWGECWTYEMWSEFKVWYEKHTEDDIKQAAMPSAIKQWTRAWSKYYNAYVVSTKKYVLYPLVSLTTNFSDAGEHGGNNPALVQVNLLQGNCLYRMGEIEKLTCYDIFSNNTELYDWIGFNAEEISLDLYGFNNSRKKYLLSTKILPYKILKSYALYMRPMELNVKYDLRGDGIYLYDTSIASKRKSRDKQINLVSYFIQGFSIRLLAKYLIDSFVQRIILKFTL